MIRCPSLYGLLFIAIITISFGAILIRLAEEAPVLTIAASRLVVSTLILAPFALRHGTIGTMNRRDLLLSIASGAFLALHFTLWISSLRYTSVASSVVLVSTNPIFVGLGSLLLLKERLPPSVGVAILMAVAGGFLIGWGDVQISGGALNGDLLALGGAIMASAYLLIGRRVRQRASLYDYILLSYGTAAVLLLGVCLATRQPLTGFSNSTYLYLILLALGPQLIGHSTFNWALKYLSASTVAILTLGEPIGSTLFAYLILGEGLTLLKGIGATIILIGIYLSLRKKGVADERGL